jgi:apoptosis-inducing factor 2
MAAQVVVVGGGYAGIAVAKALDDTLDVVLVDPKDAFVHAVAALRGLVSEPWAQRMFFDYDRLLSRGRVVRDRVVQADPAGVTTAGGTRIDADYVVLASGSAYPFPAKMDLDDSAQAQAKQAVTRETLASAQHVLLLGAGPVGLELSGEIAERWPGKEITVLDTADDVLAGRYSAPLRDSLRAQLETLGVRLILGSPLTGLPPTPPGVAAPFTVTTADGRSIEADLWFRCHGVEPASDLLTGTLATARRPDGFVEVDDRLRVAGQRTVFAAGDITAIAEPKRAGAAGRHATVVAANITALASGAEPSTVYQRKPDSILVPLGSTGGAGEVPGPDGMTVLSPEAAADRKGRDLMVARFAAMFDATPGRYSTSVAG